jgi:hypothetical protein
VADRIRTIDLLPEIFRTDTNRQFLNSTLDQLVQEPKLKPTQGYIGRRVGPGVNPSDGYVVEPDATRSNYQLEPGLVFLETNTNIVTDAITYPGYTDSLALNGANVARDDRLFASEQYSWDPLIDFDKFINFSQYYWLVDGPDAVDVSATDIPLTDDFDVARTASGYTFSGIAGTLPTLTLARQGNYTFEVDQSGSPFWIQTTPGAAGTLPQNGKSNREVLGVTNNGAAVGTISFNVPQQNAQDFFYNLVEDGTVDYATRIEFDDINGRTVDDFVEEYGGIDGVNDLENKTVVFFKPFPVESGSQAYSVYLINFVGTVDPVINLTVLRDVDNLRKISVNSGDEFGGTDIYKTAEGFYLKVPLLTATLDVLYYQDVNNPDFFGVINLVDTPDDQFIDVNTILSSANYTSPNGVVFTNGLKVKFRGTTVPESYQIGEYYVEGVGTQIQLLAVGEFITPEPYTETAAEQNDSTAEPNQPDDPDYITINRASADQNAWSRSNRWFHIDVITATAAYNNAIAVLDNDKRGKRPIIEFEAGLKLFDFGSQAIDPVNMIDFLETDALSNINGTIGYSIDGYSFVQGTTVIFANDTDDAVRNKVYQVNFVEFGDSSEPVIDLQPTELSIPGVLADQTVLITDGVTQQGKSYFFNGSAWELAQLKTSINQAPLFDVFDSNGYSFGDTDIYPGTNFAGSKLFSYADATGPVDPILGFSLKYLSINNVGDIVFDDDFYTDSFIYTENSASSTVGVDTGTVRKYTDRLNYSSLLGWKTSFTEQTTRQQFRFEYTGDDLILDVQVSASADQVPVQVYVEGVFVLPSAYTVTTNSNNLSVISFLTAPAVGNIIEVNVISDTASSVGFYTVPSNLENNPINLNVSELTLGTIRNHYNTICQNLSDFSGVINGANNTRDLGDIVPYGTLIQQQSSPMTLLGTFLYDQQFDYFRSLNYASNEYEKFKILIADGVAKTDWEGFTASEILDKVIEDINLGKNQLSPFYWTNMLPSGYTYEETTYTVTPITSNVFDTLYTYDFTQANYQGLSVYLNDQILVGNGHDYVVATDGPRITVNVAIVDGDVLKIREYTSVYENFVPSTPASLGLAQPYKPAIFLDNTYVTPTNVIRGHDGSLTVAFDDLRDGVLLEFETRIYNNIKVSDRYNPPIIEEDVVPGQFRDTDYSLNEITEMLSVSFLTWVGQNKLPYKTQTYDANDQFTWNYSNSENKLDRTPLLGGWRAIYNDLYDTDSPHLRPWEMLGFSEQPDWWTSTYGPSPYTSGNLVLWEDLKNGYIADPDNPRTDARFARDDLLTVIPVDSEGNLLSPFEVIVGSYDVNSFRKSWNVGDQGPVETAWRRSSSYQFALQRLIALTKPAQYFALFVDRDLYRYNTTFNQYLYNNRFRIDPKLVEVYGDGTAKNSYINWIVDYNRLLGLDSTTLLETRLQNIDVRLCYRLAAFSDKQYLKIFTEKSSPNSLNSSLLLPDESFQLLLYKNPPLSEVLWSSIVIQRTDTGYAVYGYSTTKPYFEIYSSIPNGNFRTITVGTATARIPKDFKNTVVRVPYGYEFTTTSGVVDFVISYGRYLTDQGMIFDTVENNTVLSWTQMAEEFLYWSQQGWATGSVININPSADLLTITKPNVVAESLIGAYPENAILNQNKKPFASNQYVVERVDNTLKLRAFENNTFSYLNAKFTAYEHIIVFDNTSIFNDLIYDPGTGARQSRLLVNGYTTYEWNGTLDAQGFILNQDNVREWKANHAYTKGEIVLYKGSYWSASEIIPPSERFDFGVWIKSDYQDIQKGLLPNIATKADLIRNYYDTNTANLERDADLLGFGLIGFRPRQYMQNLNLDDISQVNLYKQFLGIKGTVQATDILRQANLNKEVAEYEIFENWAIQRATYGANANRSYFEIQLDESLLDSNPSVVTVIEPQETTTANQQVLLSNLWKQSYKITSTDILPTTTTTPPDLALPSAGYVNYDDVSIRVFDFNDLTEVVANLDQIQQGTNIWVAKSNRYDWNVYRTVLVPATLTQAKDNLNGRMTLTFSAQHGLTVGEKIVIKFFDAEVDGAYEIITVPGLRTVTIAQSFVGDTTTVAGEGVVFVLESVRVAQASDISNLNFVNSLGAGSQVWVDDDGTGHWAVYEKRNPFSDGGQIIAGTGDDLLNARFGTSIAQGLQRQGALIGAPGYNSNSGAVYVYNKSSATNYVNTRIIAPQTTGLVGFGSAIAAGNTEWAPVGASESSSNRGYAFAIRRDPDNGSYRENQLFVESTTTADSEFGYSVAISDDERWMYIGAPGNSLDNTNQFGVYAYNKVSVQNQSVSFSGDGVTSTFDISGIVIVDDDSSDAGIGSQQLNVTVTGFAKQPNVDWIYFDGKVTFLSPPLNGAPIVIERKQTLSFFPATSTANFLIEDLYTADDIYSFSVYVNDVIQRPILDYTFNTGTKTVILLAGTTEQVIISSADHWLLVDQLSYDGVTSDSSTTPRFGHSLATTTDGRQVIIGSPHDNPDNLDFAGTVQIIDRSVERFQIVDATDRTYTTLRSPNGPVTVKLNNQFLVPDDGFNNNEQFTVAGSAVTLATTVALSVGDILEIETNTFKLMQTIQSQNSQVLGYFGQAVDQCGTNCSVYIGQPNDSTRILQGGSVERWANQNRLYGTITSTVANPVLTVGNTVRINNYDVTLTGTTVSSFVQDVNNANIPNVVASTTNGLATLSIENASAADPFIKLIVLPGVGTAFADMGFKPLAFAQTVVPPIDLEYAHFGSSVHIDVEIDSLIVGAPDGSAVLPVTFDNNSTTFDSGSVEFFDVAPRSGVAYTYDFLLSANSSALNPGKFVFGEQLYDENLSGFDKFGASVSYKNGLMLIGSPQDDLGDSSGDYGRVSQFNNVDQNFSWTQRYSQQPIVDIYLLNSVFTYDRIANGITRYLDYIDPLQGKILGTARQNINYLGGIDPARYNTGTANNNGTFWAEDYVGKIWWDTSTVRFIDYHQDSLQYKSKRWGQLFPGSSVDVYQWIESDVLPAQYTGEGEVYSTSSYTVGTILNADGLFSSKYYYWVRGLRTVANQQGKTLSVTAVAQYIENPRSSGLPYIAPVAPDSVALYNCGDLTVAKDTILHVEYDRIRNNDNVHVEYDLVADGNADSFLSTGLYRKFLDSFSGEDTAGNLVPDPLLNAADRYGVNFRPRQSLFVDRFLALENYLEKSNEVMSRYPIVETKSLDLLNSFQPEPTSASGQWDKRLANYAELTYQNLAIVPIGYRYLLVSDETNQGLWTIYTLQADRSLLLTRVQDYDTRQFWSTVDWVLPGYNTSTRPVAEVAVYSDLLALKNVVNGSSVKVKTNSFGKYEIYQLIEDVWVRVVAEDATVAISAEIWDYSIGRFGFDLEVFDSQRFDQNPKIETRQILRALNEEIFIDDLLIIRNELLILTFEYILTEQIAPEWLIKTSLIDVKHKIRDLLPFQVFRQDNQDFVLDYLREVKPYHVKVKEFSLLYDGFDTYLGNTTDFDVPAFFDTATSKFVSSVLGESFPATDPIWQTFPWNQWYSNYTLNLESVTVVDGGSGYTVAPQVTVTGTATRAAELTARINSLGEVIALTVVDPGEGYTTTPVIAFSGGNGSGAKAVPLMNNSTTRSFYTTIKFDRCEYSSSVVDWQANTVYAEGTLVRYLDAVYSVNTPADSSTVINSGAIFDPDNYTEVDPGTLSGADRTIGLYDPVANELGRELALLITGIDYPGVQVTGPLFSQNTGYDVGNYDIAPFDNIQFGPEGLPTYSDEILDAVYQSSFTDTFLGRRATDINIDGSEFIDTYSSHAPEELVPGSMFDTLDLRVYTRPGSDWEGDGHGFDVETVFAEYGSTGVTVSFADLLFDPVFVEVENKSLRQVLNPVEHYSVDWVTQTITVTSGGIAGHAIGVSAYGLGGGSQLFRQTYNGDDVGNSLTIPVAFAQINSLLVVVNGSEISSFTFAASGDFATTISFSSTYTSSDSVFVAALGVTVPQRSWSSPDTEYFVYDGSTLSFTLTNSLQGTNPANIIVLRNGFRLRPAESAEYTGDGSSAGQPYYLPTRGEINQSTIADSDVSVYVDNVLQLQPADYSVSPVSGTDTRWIEFTTPPDAGSNILISVATAAAYTLSGTSLTLSQAPIPGSVISVVTFNDTSEQQLLTQVFQGPTTEGVLVSQGYDQDGVPFDAATVSFTSGSYDFATGVQVATNEFDTGRTISNTERIWVTLNGTRLYPGDDYTVNGTVVIIGGSILGAADVLAITSLTMSVTPDTLNFRIFQDMLGNQKIIRLYPGNTTALAQAMSATNDTIYVRDASTLSEPNLADNIFGVVIIDGERITYTVRNTTNNTLSGLRRGVAGTAISAHASGASVSNAGLDQQLPAEYQQTTTKNTFTGDGTTRVFTAANVVLEDNLDSTEIEEAVRVRVGGTLLDISEYFISQVNPTEVTLINAPAAGVEIDVFIVKASVMYAQGTGTASNGIALQQQTTDALRFLRGEI